MVAKDRECHTKSRDIWSLFYYDFFMHCPPHLLLSVPVYHACESQSLQYFLNTFPEYYNFQ